MIDVAEIAAMVQVVELGTMGGDAEIVEVGNLGGPTGPAGPTGPSGSALDPKALVTTTPYTAVAGAFVPVDTTSGNVTVTLPLAPADNTVIAVRHVTQGGTNTVTVQAQGSDKFNKPGAVAPTYTLSLVNQGATFTYETATAVWYPTSQSLGLGVMDARFAATNRGAPAGGASLQVLGKNSATDYDMSWQTVSGGGGGAPTGTAGGSLAGTYPNPTLAADSVGATQIAANSVGTSELANNAVTTAQLADNSVTINKIPADSITNNALFDMVQATIKGRQAGAGTGTVQDLTAGQVKTLLAIANTDVSGLGTLSTKNAIASADITDSTVANADLVNMPNSTVKGRITTGTGVPEDLTAAQLTTLINLFSPTLKGAVPASTGLTTDYLRADSTWQTLRTLSDGAGTIANTATAGIVRVDLGTDIALTGSVKAASGPIRTSARLCTNAALPACTYVNGASGVGATLTGNANGQLADLDWTTPAVNNRVLVNNQATTFQNGLYIVTQLGDAGNPFILTRAASCDTDVDFTGGVIVDVTEGQSFAGVSFVSKTPFTVVVGTTSIRFSGVGRSNISPSDIYLGTVRNERKYCLDFEELGTPITTTLGKIPGTPVTINLSGAAAQAAQGEAAEILPGVLDLQTGTATNGYCDFQVSTTAFTFDVNRSVAFYCRCKTPVLSDGTNTYLVRVGFLQSLAVGAGATTPVAGLYFQARSGVTNWEAVSLHTSVSNGTTPNGVDTGSAQTVGYKALAIIYDPVAAAARFYVGATLVANVTTNLPSADAMGVGGTIFKSAGTTSRSFFVDLCAVNVFDARSLVTMTP